MYDRNNSYNFKYKQYLLDLTLTFKLKFEIQKNNRLIFNCVFVKSLITFLNLKKSL